MSGAKQKSRTVPAATKKPAEAQGKANVVSAEGMETGNIEKIRDILFGTQMRDYDKRFARLEDRVRREAADFREEVERRFTAVESYVKGEVESLLERMKAEQRERGAAVDEVARRLQESVANLEKKLGQLDEQAGKSSRELREQILEQSKSLSEEMRKRNEELVASMDQSTQELRSDKADRSALADLLTEMAMRLTNDAALRLDLGSGGSNTEDA